MNSKPLKNLINKATFRSSKPTKRATIVPNVHNTTTTDDNNENLNVTGSQNDITLLNDTTLTSSNDTIIFNKIFFET